jgi:hypothetical protein
MRGIGTGLFSSRQRHPESLVGVVDATITWRRRLDKIFPLPAVSTDHGWNIAQLQRSGLFVGSVGSGPSRKTADRVTYDLARTMTAGFRVRTGAVVWRDPGSSYMCFLLPCRGESLKAYSTDGEQDDLDVGVRLRQTGTISGRLSASDPKIIVSRNARVIIEGFAPASGRTLWRFDAGRALSLITLQVPLVLTGRNTVVLENGAGRLVALNLGSGARHPIAASAPGWCRKPIIYTQRVPTETGGLVATKYIGHGTMSPCTANLRSRRVPAHVPAVVAAVGTRAGGLAIWSTAGGIWAAPIGS